MEVNSCEECLPEAKKLLVEIVSNDDELFSVEVDDTLKECKDKGQILEYYSRSVSILSFIKNEIPIWKIIDNTTGRFFHNYINPNRKMESSHLLNLINRSDNRNGKNFEESSF